eukprot:jgi/Botrbrau1/18265/Bobra.0840s0001.1
MMTCTPVCLRLSWKAWALLSAFVSAGKVMGIRCILRVSFGYPSAILNISVGCPVGKVTGASGFVASELVRFLLEKGYHVKATVRSLTNKEKVGHLIALGEALPGSLELVEADLFRDGSFDKAVEGATYVFHTASPFILTGITDPKKELVEPAVKGTLNVLGSVAKSQSIKRVVLTSSIVAVASVAQVLTKEPPQPPYHEGIWNRDSDLEHDPYSLSKREAEEEAWKFAKEHNIDLVTILPALVLGPVLSSRSDGASVQIFKDWLEGRGGAWFPYIIDVRDVALAHFRAATLPEASGRYFASIEIGITPRQMIQILSESFPQYTFEQPDDNTQSFKFLTNSRLREGLGVTPLPARETLEDMVRTLVAVGVAHPKAKA